ncbi:M23 family metallopeptidase [Patescibacteria group bacterium]|nr:M23 family metallopeptidase [Patescibacteria group bacterium]MCL5797450.1 M23 family metallopeptidase [Patescibacteria group bacterium]
MKIPAITFFRSYRLRTKPLQTKLGGFFQEVQDWLRFLYYYFQKRIVKGAVHFENIKDVLVDLLLVKRGRYSKHFLNISFLFLVAGAIVGGPVIADYYPTVHPNTFAAEDYAANTSSSLSQQDLTTTTVVSDKPRFDIIDYEVVKGDTLASIADKFGISVDTIKWANSLKTEMLIPGQSLRIPPVTGIVAKVAPGDTIYSLAKKYKSDAQKIVNFPANDFADLDTFALNVGQTLFIPDGVMPDAAPIYQPAPVPQFIAGGGGKFMWPTQGVITQYPVSYHMAVDIANPSAPPVAAAGDGVISYAGCITTGYGCHIIINHDGGYQTLYAHLQAIYVKVGQSVSRGQVIGKMGSTGRSTGTHTHFEVRLNGVLLNPLNFLK